MKQLADGNWQWPRYQDFLPEFIQAYMAVDPTIVTDFDRYVTNFPKRTEICQHYAKKWLTIKQDAGLNFQPTTLSVGELLNFISEIWAQEPVNLYSLMKHGITEQLVAARFESLDRLYAMLHVTSKEN
ncbi:hypothetical protein [Loigolactobacillus backii]|uniref:hypothetical protein n=1 Tax=Loigolactobacillus backii TaxID=375175 RepID=UPI000B0F1A13|nr:hypothetical protein [Loigolactobacillus backii]